MKASAIVAILSFAAANAAAVSEPRIRFTSCGVWGESCARDATPEDRANWSRSVCGVPGNACSVAKRAALAVADALAAPDARIRFTSCGVWGESCAKARRDIQEIGSLTDGVLSKVLSVDNDEVAKAKRDELLTKVSNVKDSNEVYDSICDQPGVDCTKAKRGLDLVKEDFPLIHKQECFTEGGECNTISKAHQAFHAAVKREADARIRFTSCGVWGESCARDADARIRFTSCGVWGESCARDAAVAEQEKLKGNPELMKAEEECYGPDGACTAAEKYLAELEDAINKANEAAHTS